MDIVSFLIGFLAAVFISIVLFYLVYDHAQKRFTKRLLALFEEKRGVQTERDSLSKRLQEAQIDLIGLKEQLRFSEEKLAYLTEQRDGMKREFETIAREVMEQRAKKEQESIRDLLTPFSENIRHFQQKVESFYIEESKERFSLVKEIQALKSLNERLSQDALNLTSALKGDNRLQGNWGELILEKVLESSGLVKGREYEIQKGYRDEEGKLYKPDVIVHLPDNKDVVIDSKLSLKAYEAYHSAVDEQSKAHHLKAHVDSILMHIKGLSQKRYERLKEVRSLDFVLMFIPIEAAFMAALSADKHLYEKAYQKNIILVSPSTLLAVLRTIEHAWRYEYQNKNAREIAKRAGDLYDKFNGFLESMQTIEKSLHKAQSAYDDAFKKLSSGKGNLISRAEALKKLEGVERKGSLGRK
jgi:DNA recombination protein RmuC